MKILPAQMRSEGGQVAGHYHYRTALFRIRRKLGFILAP
jgi:hypothetical protein